MCSACAIWLSAGALGHLAGAQPLMEVAEGLETPIQLIYLLTLLGFLAGGAYLVARQVLIRRELDEAAKALGERIRTGEASCEVCQWVEHGWRSGWAFATMHACAPLIHAPQDYYELGVILARKKLYTQSTKNLEKAKKMWDGEESELAQVRCAAVWRSAAHCDCQLEHLCGVCRRVADPRHVPQLGACGARAGPQCVGLLLHSDGEGGSMLAAPAMAPVIA